MIIGNFAKLNRSTRDSVFAALIVIAAIAMYNWIVAPHVDYLFAAQQYEFAIEKSVEKNKAIAREIEVKTKKLEELSKQLAQSQSKIFTSDKAKKFFGYLQTVLEETGYTVHSLNLSVSKPRPGDKQSAGTSGIVANRVTLSISGQYNNIVKLMDDLQNYTKKVWVDSFKIKVIDFSSGQLKCDMAVTIYTTQDKEASL